MSPDGLLEHALDAEITPQPERVRLRVGGMSCAACAARVERKLNKLDGVSASVNYATAIATIDAPAGTHTQDLCAVVERAGYTAQPPTTSTGPAGPDAEASRALWLRLAAALVLFIPLSDLSIMFATVASTRFAHWQWLLCGLAAPVVTWAAWPLHRAALRGARHRTATMDTLVSTGIIAATVWSVYAMFVQTLPVTPEDGVWSALRSSGDIYLDTAAGITVFVLAGRYFEAKAKHRAGGALTALAALTARDAAVLVDSGRELRIPISELKVGQRCVVRPGETIPADGVIDVGTGSIDTSAMTGEPVPRDATVGDEVTGGTTVTGGRLIIVTTAVGADTALAAMVRMVEQAQAGKAAVQRLADKVAGVFVPIVFLLATLTLGGWLLAGAGAEHAMNAALGVLVIACPCALGLATPTALMVASGRGAQLGIFIKGHQALEASRRIDTVVFDKTGTITTGQMSVAEVITEPTELNTADSLLVLIGAVENASEHAIGRAIATAALRQVTPLPDVADFEYLPGLGVTGTVNGCTVLAGNLRLFDARGIAIPQPLADAADAQQALGRTVILASVDGVANVVFALTDTPKESAVDAIGQLRRHGLRTIMLTGDNSAAAAAVAAAVGIDDTVAEMMPADKVAYISALQAAGRRVAMVGDGINDGPALAAADLGLAIGTGTDVAIGAADIILVRDDLSAVPDALNLAHATLRTIRGNLAWAFGYNVAAIPLAAAGLLDPLIAGAAMALSSLFVVSNSLRLRRYRAETAR